MHLTTLILFNGIFWATACMPNCKKEDKEPELNCDSKKGGFDLVFKLEPHWLPLNLTPGEWKFKYTVTKNIGMADLDDCIKFGGISKVHLATDMKVWAAVDDDPHPKQVVEVFKTLQFPFAAPETLDGKSEDKSEAFPKPPNQLQYKGCNNLVVSTTTVAESPSKAGPLCVGVKIKLRYVKGIKVHPCSDGPCKCACVGCPWNSVRNLAGNRNCAHPSRHIGDDGPRQIQFLYEYTTVEREHLGQVRVDTDSDAGILLYKCERQDSKGELWLHQAPTANWDFDTFVVIRALDDNIKKKFEQCSGEIWEDCKDGGRDATKFYHLCWH